MHLSANSRIYIIVGIPSAIGRFLDDADDVMSISPWGCNAATLVLLYHTTQELQRLEDLTSRHANKEIMWPFCGSAEHFVRIAVG